MHFGFLSIPYLTCIRQSACFLWSVFAPASQTKGIQCNPVVAYLCCLLLVAACRSVNTVLQKQLTEEKNSKEEILRHRDQLSVVSKLIFLLLTFHLLFPRMFGLSTELRTRGKLVTVRDSSTDAFSVSLSSERIIPSDEGPTLKTPALESLYSGQWAFCS